MKNIDHPCWGQREEAEGTWEEIAEFIEKKSPKDNGEPLQTFRRSYKCAASMRCRSSSSFRLQD